MKNKQTIKEVISNNLFILKICYTAAPIYLFTFIIDIIRAEVIIFFEHTYGIGYVLLAVETGKPFHSVAIFLIALFLINCAGMVLNSVMWHRITPKGQLKIKLKLKQMLYDKAKELDLECYDNPSYYNDFVLSVSEADKQVDRMFDFLKKLFAGFSAFITTGAFFLIHDSISVIFVVVSLVLSLMLSRIFKKLRFKIRLEKNPHERKRTYINRVFYLNDYAKELRLNPEISNKLYKEFRESNDAIYNIDKSNARKKFSLGFVRGYMCNNFISDVLYITYLVYKATVLWDISYSYVVVLYNSFGKLKRSLRVFTEVYPFASETSLYVNKIRIFLAYKPMIVSDKQLNIPKEPRRIGLSNVSFAYTQEEGNVINDINLVIRPYEKIALVGYNGSGKTTLIKLLMRLYDTISGEIKLDNIDIKDYDVKQYRDYIGAVFQDFMIYAATVKENVLLDISEDESEKDIELALQYSGFENRLKSMKLGLETPLTAEFEEDGVCLSGGEAQKIALARAFYKNSSLIVLDEPSSALDPIAEYQLNQLLHNVEVNKTVIYISHRLSTTRFADRILMMENGKIIEAGTHEELLEINGKYSEMWRAQAGQFYNIM